MRDILRRDRLWRKNESGHFDLFHFLPTGFDNLFQDVCLQELPVVFAIDRAGLAGQMAPPITASTTSLF